MNGRPGLDLRPLSLKGEKPSHHFCVGTQGKPCVRSGYLSSGTLANPRKKGFTRFQEYLCGCMGKSAEILHDYISYPRFESNKKCWFTSYLTLSKSKVQSRSHSGQPLMHEECWRNLTCNNETQRGSQHCRRVHGISISVTFTRERLSQDN